ncbi:MAG: hypothetical protein Q4D51_01690 [Eubacteriales bacterium]|nr:hypothetical protein [Eubacteriales bacterium]
MIVKKTYKIPYNEINTDAFIKRYHFEGNDRELIQATLFFVCEMMCVDTAISYETDGVVGVATLGKRYDSLQELTMDGEQLSISYCMECLSMELLSKAYAYMNETVFEKKGVWLSTYHFLEEYEMTKLAECDELLHAVDVVWEKGMLKPLKSVVFRADYTSIREQSDCHDCSQCNNISCSFRKVMEEKRKLNQNVEGRKQQVKAYSYGASMIFGGDRT